MNWTIVIDAHAEKQLKRFPAKDYNRIRLTINAMAIDPFSGDINKLNGEEDSWRRRVGNYRVFYEIYIEKKLIYVSEIKRRTSSAY